jgi:hypothetical protein
MFLAIIVPVIAIFPRLGQQTSAISPSRQLLFLRGTRRGGPRTVNRGYVYPKGETELTNHSLAPRVRPASRDEDQLEIAFARSRSRRTRSKAAAQQLSSRRPSSFFHVMPLT